MKSRKELSSLRTLNATHAMINALKEPGNKRNFYRDRGQERYRYRYRMAARCQHLGDILKISICVRTDIENKIYTPKWDVFLDYKEDAFITRERQDDGSYTWRSVYIYNLENYDWNRRDWDEEMYINKEGTASIKKTLNTKKAGYAGIVEWQQASRQRQSDKKIKEQKDEWNRKMKPVRDLPKKFEDWWHHNAFDGDNYIFYDGAGATTGYCTSCLGLIPLDTAPTHRMWSRCPVCKKGVTYISRKKATNKLWTSSRTVSCVQRCGNSLIQRLFSVSRKDIKDSISVNKSQFFIIEYKRTILTDKGTEVFVYGNYKLRGQCWHRSNDQSIGMEYCVRTYPYNIKRLCKKTHTAYDIAIKHGYVNDFVHFMVLERKYPIIEQLYKAGLYALGKDLSNRTYKISEFTDESQRDLSKKLKIDAARMKRLGSDGGIKTLLWLQEEKQNDTIYRDANIKTLVEAEIKPEDLIDSSVYAYLPSIQKICNYLEKQRTMCGGKKKLYDIWSDWNDYVDMMEKMKMDCESELLLKPKDLDIEHNNMVAKISMLRSGEEIKRAVKKFKNAEKLLQSGVLKKYEYTDGKFCIVAPASIKDIFWEGTVLKHCIHTCDIYFQRIDIKQTYLLFLRRQQDPDRPWYTLEIEPGGNIRQKKSILNEAYDDLKEAVPFLKKWQKWVKTNLSAEDKKLAEKSDKARKAEYKKLREDKKIIWHGSLQGTLLADALEEDFMAVEEEVI